MATKYTSYVLDPETKQYVKINSTSSSGGLTYNDLEDQPVINAHGTSVYSFINVAGLDYGSYNISGYYKFDSNSDLYNTGSEYVRMIVTTDTETGKKVAIYETSENYKVVTHIVIYDGSYVERVIDQGPGTYWNTF